MSFKIKWQPAARDELTDLWLEATSDIRRKVTASARDIDRALKHNPQNAGESRPNDRRVLFAAPLAVLFEVDEDAEIVRILKTWRF